MDRSVRPSFLCSAIAAFVLMLPISAAYGQSSTTGAIRGTITDPQGAVITGATVTVTSKNTGTKRTAVSGGDGVYNVGLLPPGDYTVTFGASGFKTVVPPQVTVIVTETGTLNATMILGNADQTVEVTTGEQLLQSENATLGTVVEGKTIQEVPLTQRNYTQVLTMSPGVAGDVNNAASLGKGTQDVYVNGASSISNNFHMDGADINNFGSGRAGDFVQQAGIAIPNPDALQEFKIQTTLYDAGFGRDAGANVDVITKSGSNQFHGALWEFFRNDVLNANDTFLKGNGQHRPVMKQNQFGGTIGGPIIKDKFFFFGSYQGTRQSNGLSTSSYSSNVLPPLTDDRSAAGIGKIFCQNFPGFAPKAGTVRVACDGSNINPVALKLLNEKIPNGTYLVPTPQTARTAVDGTPQGFSAYTIPAKFSEDQFIINTDYIISQKHTVSQRYFFSRDPQNQPFSTCSAGCTPGNGVTPNFTSHVADLKLSSAVTSHFLNEALIAFVRNTGHLQTQATIPASELGITPSDPTYPLMPDITVSGSFSLGGSNNDVSFSTVDTFEIADQISWTHGRQSIRAGWMGEKQIFNFDDPNNRRGAITFLSFSDLLLGLNATQNGSGIATGQSNLNASSSAQGTYYKAYRAIDMASFVQDDIKLRPNLTVNAGVRWELNGGVSEAHGHLSSFWPSISLANPLPTTAGSFAGFVVPSNYPLTVPTGVTKLDGKTLASDGMPLHNFGPRIGFAWQPSGSDGTTVLRGGYGVFYTLPNGNSVLQTLTAQPFVSTAALSNTGNALATFANPFTTVLTPGVWKPRTPTSSLSASIVAQNIDSPLTQQYNLDLQQQLRDKLVLEIGYVGTRGTRLAELRNINLPSLATPTNPINGLTTSTTASTNLLLRVPYVGFGPTSLTRIETYGFSMYNSMQVALKKQMSRGLYLQAAYTWGQVLTTVTGGYGTNGVFGGGSGNSNNADNRYDRYGPAGFDRTNRFVLVYNWQLPSLKSLGTFSRVATSGWAFSGVTTVQSGLPLTFTDTRNGAVFGATGSARAQFAPGKGNNDIKAKAGSMLQRRSAYFTPATTLFTTAPIIGNDANSTAFGNSRIGAARGPGQNNYDMALSKTTTVGGLREGATLDFRTEFFNTFNHAQYSNPGTAVGTASFGVIGSSSVAPRLIQFALKYVF